jgi:hypothetical protein
MDSGARISNLKVAEADTSSVTRRRFRCWMVPGNSDLWLPILELTSLCTVIRWTKYSPSGTYLVVACPRTFQEHRVSSRRKP